jgi:alkyl sulfatase BDS1-like metallo-beta-lactamase superfamily hydrolase
MSRDPLYKSLSKGPEPALFDNAYRVNDFIVCCPAFTHTYLLETSEGAVLVNTGMGLEAPVIEHNLKQLSDQATDIKYVITTQGHVDHVGGMQYFRNNNPGVLYIAQAGNPEHQALDARIQDFRARRSAFRFGDLFARAFTNYSEHNYSGDNPQDKPDPNIIFEESWSITLGELEIELIAIQGAETNDSLVVWLPQHRICLTGNLFGCLFGNFPNLVTVRGDKYRDALVVADAAQRILDLEPEMILYGRHKPIIGKHLIQTEVTAIRDATLFVHDEVVKGMNEGESLHTLMQEITLPPEMEVGEGYGKIPWSVRAIWENYAGWFHHQSTTELYCVPQSDIHGDLVELAGADALVQRAREKFNTGENEEALHLLDIVFTTEPAKQEAIDLSIAVHEKLLEEPYAAENFWLRGWIENRIKLLKGGVTRPLSVK